MAITRIGNPAIADQRGINFRNIIINGDMSIAQRGTSTASITGGGYYTCDRFHINMNGLGTWTQSQSTDVPTAQGFVKSLKMDCTTANASPSADEYLVIETKFEGQNLQYLKKGTSSAESLTLSFWIKSSKTGDFVAEIDDNDNSRHINKLYTINSANTWEKKIITYAGDTSGTLDNDNAHSLRVMFWFGSGTTHTGSALQTSWGSQNNTGRADGCDNMADSTSNEFYITGVQLEAGQVASDFEFLPVDVNKDRCFRYYQLIAKADASSMVICNGAAYSASDFYGVCSVGKPMRAEPSFTAPSGTSYYTILSQGVGYTINSINAIQNVSNDGGLLKCRIYANPSGMPTGNGAWLRFNGAANGNIFEADAEL